jgi:hypothetical protein
MVQLPHKVKGNMEKSKPQHDLDQPRGDAERMPQTGFSISINRCPIENRSAR